MGKECGAADGRGGFRVFDRRGKRARAFHAGAWELPRDGGRARRRRRWSWSGPAAGTRRRHGEAWCSLRRRGGPVPVERRAASRRRGGGGGGGGAEIWEGALRPAEGALHVDEPWGVVERAERATGRDGIGGRQLAPGEAALESGEDLAAKQCPEDADREEMALAGGPPAATVGREAARRDDAMDVRMKRELPRPGVEHRRDAELGPEPLRIVSEREEGLGRGAQQERKDLPPM